jgi:hypothetical protein
MSRKLITALINHCHKLSDLIFIILVQVFSSPRTINELVHFHDFSYEITPIKLSHCFL